MNCRECGEEMWIEENGVSHHWGNTIDDIDYDLDADHVAYGDDDSEESPEDYDTSDPYDIEYDVP